MQRRTLFTAGIAALSLPGLSRPASAPSSQVFDVRRFGATGDGKTKDTASIQKAIDSAFKAGGGVVYLPPGTYLSGGIELKTDVTFHIEAGATLLGSTDIKDYPSHAGPEPGSDANDKHLVFARGAENVAITGGGTIDGQGKSYWVRNPKHDVPPEEEWRDVATLYWKALPRPSPMVEMVECRNVHIENVTLQNSPGWTLRPIACDSVFIQRVKIRNPIYGINTDGIDPTCSQNVFISDCDINTGDDNICLKSGNPYGPLRVTKNIVVTNCVLSGCCNGFKIGTGTRGGFENITFSNSVIFNNDVPLKERMVSGIAVEMVDGGWVDGVLVSNVRLQNIRTPLFIRLGNRGSGQQVKTPGQLRNVVISDVHAVGAILTSSITGLPGYPAERITLNNVHLETVEQGKAEWTNREIPELPEHYPAARMFGRLPSYGLYIRHVKDIAMSGLRVHSNTEDPRPMLTCDDVQELTMDRIGGGSAAKSTAAFLDLRNVQGAFIHGSVAPRGVDAYARVSGANSTRITLLGNELGQAAKVVEMADGCPPGSVASEANHTGMSKS